MNIPQGERVEAGAVGKAIGIRGNEAARAVVAKICERYNTISVNLHRNLSGAEDLEQVE